MATGTDKTLSECEIRHAPLVIEVANLKEGIARVERASETLGADVWAAIDGLQKTAGRLDKAVSDMNGKLIIIVGGGGLAVQILARYVLGGVK